MTAAEAQNLYYSFTGTLTGNISVIWPTGAGQCIVSNATTGAFTLTVKPLGGTGVVITQGTRQSCFISTTLGAAVLANTTAGSGTVTSVTYTGDGIVHSATPSTAVTGSGTVLATLSTQAANRVLSGPTTGSAATPTFRALVAADLPLIDLASGITGNLPISNLNSGTSAGATTFWRGDATWATPSAVVLSVQQFTASGTYTPTSGMKYCIIEMCGSGAGGGSVAASSNVGGGGGGSGGYLRALLTAAQISTSQTITINNAGAGGAAGANNAGANGGTATVGSLLSCNGGTGGSAGGAQVSGGSGGSSTVSTGTTMLVLTGQTGGVGAGTSTISIGGEGGLNPLGIGGSQGVAIAGGIVNGLAGTGYGAGGAGGANSSAGSSQSGGAGAKGVIIITEFA